MTVEGRPLREWKPCDVEASNEDRAFYCGSKSVFQNEMKGKRDVSRFSQQQNEMH